MPQLTEASNLPPPPYNGSESIFRNATIRQTLHMSIGAKQIRLRFSNAFGINDLPIDAVTVALPYNGSAGVRAIVPRTLKTVTFSGNSSFIVPNGALVVSDPIDFDVKPQSMLTVTMYLASGQQGMSITSHPGSRTTSWFAEGNQVSETNLTGSDVESAAHWYFVSAVEAWSSPQAGALVVVGDSITDGRGSSTDANNRWPDLLLAKMQKNPATSSIAVVNQAAGGNRVLYDGLGPNALGRIDRDVLSHSGVRYAMIFEGVNDIGVAASDTSNQTATYERLIAAYEQIILRVHTFGIPVLGATITPFSAPNSTIQAYSTPLREQTRQKLNGWIRNSGKFDAVVDFDKMLADPKMPSQLYSEYNSGDYLHPNVAGYQKLADEFPLAIFGQFAGGVSGYS
ncbi:hypothetical protein LTS18_013709 [Coniosporium uncinatum]|uniref:Uncharacterized protein n=1 Tax=Coniosporium uncinatum TaxID=93489 RepID=A0ACC3D957_9PEZI|nr:hypothetical protein LTS18_013709 [Coniosporium uncinatum]